MIVFGKFCYTISNDVKSQWQVDENHGFYDSQMKYCDLFRSDQLYIDLM